jgi:ubiquinone/menaquinone biosynthesis C-methylase UbiE
MSRPQIFRKPLGPMGQINRALKLARTTSGRRQLAMFGLLQVNRVFSVWFPPAAYQRLEDVAGLPNLVTREAIRVFVTLGIPNLISAGVTDITALAEDVGVDAIALSRVARHLITRGILAAPRPGELRLTNVGELLCSDYPERHNVDFNLSWISPRIEKAIGNMMHSVQTGGPAYAQVNGAEMWNQLAEEPLVAASFDTIMVDHARLIGSALLEHYDLSDVSRITDIGGGTGELMKQVLEKFVDMRGVIVEYAASVIRAQETMEKAGLSERCSVVQANFLESVPTGADVYILSWILHDWNDEHAQLILERCRVAAQSTGRILIVEKAFDREVDTDLDLRMLVLFGGKERTRDEFEALAESASLRPISWTELGYGYSVLECRAR